LPVPALDNLERFEMMASLIAVLFVMAFGACIGSLLNVLVYRLPLGLDVVTPTSRCPSCETHLTWRENIPVFGWLLLRGRCRFCRSPISPEYPLVEAFVAVLWALVFLVLYAPGGTFFGVDFGALRPEWAEGGFRATWPMFLAVVGVFSCLVAMTLVDAKTCFIPMQLTTTPVVIGLLAHPIAAAWVQHQQGGLTRTAAGWTWAIATPGPQGWWWIGASIGGAAGLVLSNILLAKKLIRRSFEGYEEWEKEQIARAKAEAPQDAPAEEPAPPVRQGGSAGLRVLLGLVLFIAAMSVASAYSQDAAKVLPWAITLLVPTVGLWGIIQLTGDDPETHPTDMWIQYPHARREMFKELVFLAPCISLGLAGGMIATRLAGPMVPLPDGTLGYSASAPLWLEVLAGVLMGYLIGGGAVWLMRIGGTLGFGREAIGLGDVHLMAGVGACLGWTDAVLGFFGSAFIGVFFWVLGLLMSGKYRKAMPFGPYLAMGTMLVWFAKPGIEGLLTWLSKASPAVSLP
jgi:prepilin signal peptidase PulO-like enzyme (type II secretory pathway)